MDKQRWIGFFSIGVIAMMVLIFIFSIIHSGSLYFQTGKTNGETSSRIDNNIQNNVNGDQAEVSNTIHNNVNTNRNSPIENNVANNIDVHVNIKVTNNINNNIKGQKSPSDTDSKNDDNKEEPSNKEKIAWGVDSANAVTNESLACVRDNFGDPKVWGRYLGEKEGVSEGLTTDEVKLLHSNNIKVLVIWNHFTNATGYENGKNEARLAIEEAKKLGIPQGTALFADIEPSYPVDAGFIKGWFEEIDESEYKPGIYGVFDAGSALSDSFKVAGKDKTELLKNTYIWTASPNVGITAKTNAPDYGPDAPKDALIGGWQYGIDAQSCNIDTNLFSDNLINALW